MVVDEEEGNVEVVGDGVGFEYGIDGGKVGGGRDKNERVGGVYFV